MRLPHPWRPAHTAVVCRPATLQFAEWAHRRNIPVRDITSGHDVMITMPEALTDLLVDVLASARLDPAPGGKV